MTLLHLRIISGF